LFFIIDKAGSAGTSDKTNQGFSTPNSDARAIADRTGNYSGNSAIQNGPQTGSLGRNYVRKQDRLGRINQVVMGQ
jgi:hypothetical protein